MSGKYPYQKLAKKLKYRILRTLPTERFEKFIEGMKQSQGKTEYLKAEIALEWIEEIII